MGMCLTGPSWFEFGAPLVGLALVLGISPFVLGAGAMLRGWRVRHVRAIADTLPDDVAYTEQGRLRWAEVEGATPTIAVRPGRGSSGDPELDAVAVVEGDALAILDAPARALLRELVTPWGGVEAGVVRAGIRGEVAGRADLARRVAAALRVPADVPAALARIAIEDPCAPVRLRAFVRLGRPREVAQRLRVDLDPLVRLVAAETLADGETAAACLARLGDPAAEARLIALLQESDVRATAAAALARVGTVRAVARLRALGFHREAEAILARGSGTGWVSVASAGGELAVAGEAGDVAVVG